MCHFCFHFLKHNINKQIFVCSSVCVCVTVCMCKVCMCVNVFQSCLCYMSAHIVVYTYTSNAQTSGRIKEYINYTKMKTNVDFFL